MFPRRGKPKEDGLLVGKNVLGRLLMELRDQFRDTDEGPVKELKYPVIPRLFLFGRPMEASARKTDIAGEIQTSMFD
jgi:hypothetical protein